MTELVLFNTLGRKLETFQPLVPGEARVYICGPTVYNEVHIGNLRTFLFGDLLRRSLQYLGLRVTQVMNLTDVDDKTIQGAHKAGLSLPEYTGAVHQDLPARPRHAAHGAGRALPQGDRAHPGDDRASSRP